jgi:cystathionine beta-lyase
MVDSCYQPTRRFCEDVLARFGIGTRYYDPAASAEQIAAMLSGKTRAIFLESPGSMTFEVQDVPGICELARRRGIVTLLDNTWATPMLFRAIEHGVDLSILACTKYVSGHSDVLLGSVTATADHWQRLCDTYAVYGQAVGADDAYLAARGLRTMGVRLRQHQASGLEVARWLDQRAEVARVLHPALESCPGHALWKRDFGGASGLFSIELKESDQAAAARFVDALELFGIGYSWGGFESLAVPFERRRARSLPQPEGSGAIVRLHIGLEDPADLIADLERGFTALR